jgi:hypothetical protein
VYPRGRKKVTTMMTSRIRFPGKLVRARAKPAIDVNRRVSTTVKALMSTVLRK